MKQAPDKKPVLRRITRTINLIKDKATGDRRPDPASSLTNRAARERKAAQDRNPSVARTQHPAPGEIHAQTFENGDMTLRDIIGMISVYRRTAAIVAALCVLAALVYVVARERPYVANTRVLLDPLGIQVLDRDFLRRAESSDGGAAMVESHMRVMTSESVLKQVVISQNLGSDPEFIGKKSGFLTSLTGGLFKSGGTPVDPQIKALINLEKAVETSRPQRSFIIDLYVKTKDAEKSARLANAITQTYIESELDARSGLARRASGTLTARLAELRFELAEAENAVERFKSENNILEANGNKVNEQDLEQLNRLLGEAEARTTLAQSNLDQIETARQSASDLNNIPEALSSSTISGLRIRLATALQRRSVLSAQLLASHPTMAAVEAEVIVVSQQIKQELTRIVGRARADLDRARAEQQQIEQRLDKIKQSTYLTNDARVRLRELNRDADTKRSIYESFLLRARELGEQQGVDTNQARIISNAIPPLRPSGPSSILILAVALLIGIASGIVAALLRSYFAIVTAPLPYTVPQAADSVSWPAPEGAQTLPRPKRRTRPTRRRLEAAS